MVFGLVRYRRKRCNGPANQKDKLTECLCNSTMAERFEIRDGLLSGPINDESLMFPKKKSYEKFFEKFFENFLNFSKTFCSFRSFENFSRNRSRRDDSFGPKIVEFRAILAIFRPFEDGNKSDSLY